jgi:tetratricopeptide (TPR) repeat protein
MKSERRHELQHNELAEWLIQGIEAFRPHQNTILTVVLAIVVAAAAYTLWSRAAASKSVQAWEEVNGGLAQAMASGNVDTLTKVVESNPNTPASETAAVLAGDIRLANACTLRFSNKASAEVEFSKAIEMYEKAIKNGGTSSLTERAVFGLAQAYESKGKLEAAEKEYREVLKNWPAGAYAGEAKQRLDDLKRPETRQMYDDFANFDPSPEIEKSETKGAMPKVDMNELPKEKPAGFPGDTVELKGDGKAKETPKKSLPAEAKKPAEAKPPVQGKKAGGK